MAEHESWIMHGPGPGIEGRRADIIPWMPAAFAASKLFTLFRNYFGPEPNRFA
jgi:hypothetical protein